MLLLKALCWKRQFGIFKLTAKDMKGAKSSLNSSTRIEWFNFIRQFIKPLRPSRPLRLISLSLPLISFYRIDVNIKSTCETRRSKIRRHFFQKKYATPKRERLCRSLQCGGGLFRNNRRAHLNSLVWPKAADIADRVQPDFPRRVFRTR